MEQKLVPAYEGKNPYIFVSYAHLDSQKVLPVVNELFDRKYRMWYDEGIAPGSEWPKNIAEHLSSAEAVIIFVSENSLKSPNCENEVVRTLENGKEIIRYSLDGRSHPKLSDDNSTDVGSTEELLTAIPEKYIGDGTGYERTIGKQKHGAVWNALIAVAAVLVMAIGVGLLGLNKGWFDSYLPGLDKSADGVAESQQMKEEQENNITSPLIAGAIVAQTNKSGLNDVIRFENKKASNTFYNTLKWDKKEEHKYYELTYWEGDSLELDYCNQEMLSLMSYFPNLKKLRLNGGKISNLIALAACPRLEKVYIPYKMFPLTFPLNAGFEVILNEQ